MATPYSSPDLYFRLQPVETHNWELAGQVLMAKQQKYDANLAQVENLVQQYVGLDIANKDAKNHLYSNLKTLTAEVDRLASTEDLSNGNATKNITAYIGQAIDDTTINAVNTTRMKRQYDATWEEIRQKKPVMYSDINRRYGESGWNNYVNADKNANVYQYVRNGFSVKPYIDVEGEKNKVVMDFMKIAKDKEYSVPIQVLNKETGKMETQGFNKYVETGINPIIIKGIMESTLSPQVLDQMSINSWARYGEYSEEGVELLKKDFTSHIDKNIADVESSIATMELKSSQVGKGSTEEKTLKKNLSDYRTSIGALKDRKASTLASINNGNYSSAGVEVESAKYVNRGVSIFGSFYDNYFKGTESNDIFWKQADFDQKERFHNDSMEIQAQNLLQEREKAKKEEMDFLNTGISYIPVTETNTTAQSSESLNRTNVIESQNKASNLASSWIREIDNILIQNNPGTITDTAFALREKYAKVLGLKDKSYKNMSISTMVGTYDKFRDKISELLVGEDVGITSPLATLSTGNMSNRAITLKEARDVYKKNYSEFNKIETDRRNSIFTDSAITSVLANDSDAKVMVNQGGKMVVRKASEVFKSFINENGSWKNTTTEEQKKRITDRIKQTYDIQSGKLKSDLEKGVLTYEDATVKEWMSLDPNDKYELANKRPSELKGDRTAANKQAIDRHNKIREARTSVINAAVLPSKLSNGKDNPMFAEVANTFNNQKGIVLDHSQGNTVSVTPNSDGSFTFKATTYQKKDGASIPIPVTMRLSADEVSRAMPTFFNQNGIRTAPKQPVHTYENIGVNKVVNKNVPYYQYNDIQQAMSVTAGDMDMANALTVNGAISLISKVDPTAYQGLSNTFENFNQKMKDKLEDINGNYYPSVGYSADKNSTEITLNTKDGKHIFTINRPLDSDGSIDTSAKMVNNTPAILVNQLIAELIRVNYYNTNGDFDNSAWRLLMGDMKRKDGK